MTALRHGRLLVRKLGQCRLELIGFVCVGAVSQLTALKHHIFTINASWPLLREGLDGYQPGGTMNATSVCLIRRQVPGQFDDLSNLWCSNMSHSSCAKAADGNVARHSLVTSRVNELTHATATGSSPSEYSHANEELST